jgi:hypothetical protein
MTVRDKTDYESGIYCTTKHCKGELTYLLLCESIAGCPVCGCIYDLSVEEGIDKSKEID